MSASASSGKVVSILVPVELQEALEGFLDSYQQAPRNLADPQQLHQVEQQLANRTDQLLAASMQAVLQEAVAAREPSRHRRSLLLPSWLRLLAAPAKQLKNQGRRCVQIRLSRGRLCNRTPIFRRKSLSNRRKSLFFASQIEFYCKARVAQPSR